MKKPRRLVSIFLCLSSVALLALGFSHFPFRSNAARSVRIERQTALQLSGEAARKYLTQSSDGRSLMETLTAARFGLRWQKHGPAEREKSDGYLGLSHDQNLNVWFGGDGMTVHPMSAETKPDPGWSMALRLRAYGYGTELVDAPPTVARRRRTRVRCPPSQAPGICDWLASQEYP